MDGLLWRPQTRVTQGIDCLAAVVLTTEMNGVVEKMEKKSAVMNEEFDNFMVKVNEVNKLINQLSSDDKTEAEKALQVVDSYLGDPDKLMEDINEDSLRVKTCRTSINQKAFDSLGKEPEGQQSPETFMKSVEEDAKMRTEQRKAQKEASDTLKKRAITAFNKGEFEKAFSFYNKAIEEFRSSTQLYNSRALTCLKLKLYRRTIEDCDLVLRCFDEKSLKALLYKAKAHSALGEETVAKQCVEDAIKNHPKCENVIREYINKQDD